MSQKTLVKPIISLGDLEKLDIRVGTIEKVEEGKQALFVVNLEPKRMMGEESGGVRFDIGHADG